jgi:hypothetical protein
MAQYIMLNTEYFLLILVIFVNYFVDSTYTRVDFYASIYGIIICNLSICKMFGEEIRVG